jgi:hypothetical protein
LSSRKVSERSERSRFIGVVARHRFRNGDAGLLRDEVAKLALQGTEAPRHPCAGRTTECFGRHASNTALGCWVALTSKFKSNPQRRVDATGVTQRANPVTAECRIAERTNASNQTSIGIVAA